ncbi:hypothetical protein SODALDRAFT_324560 [Sodiomyces alkalinus F11]|uniref:Major facilitator superfamily (MFS) profile domain-containing protein n=1 Tax=Sodiomyces alkalinus (strain CBS 110278 / VKM F-3762 / F11) TaxID=1314773 RepID=A0A3N2PUF2_SODAK|nr:hypothetical protein SODALDRAFT_324560 [Sodiomyces alkalinus F11]ROT38137.1 hypothetical protein SODALDRAFT_324560 [Sodiomyces alkalinus F11]
MLPTFVAWSGFPTETGYNFIAIMNSASFLGRVLPGLVGDRLGHFNVLLSMLAVTLISTAVTLVPFGTSHIAALYVFFRGLGTGFWFFLVPYAGLCPLDNGTSMSVPIGGQMLETLGATALC